MPFRDLPNHVRAEYERIGRERERASREADQSYRREFWRVLAEIIGWTLAGLFIAGLGFAVNDHQLGMILLYGGIVINTGGVGFALWTAYQRGEDRGDW